MNAYGSTTPSPVRMGASGRRAVPASVRNFYAPEPEAGLTIDVAGRITYCSPSAARLLGRRTDALAGHAVSALIPNLPFAANTPGYNLAYAVLHSADGLWLRHTALAADGRQIPVDVAMANLRIEGNHFIALTLRQAA